MRSEPGARRERGARAAIISGRTRATSTRRSAEARGAPGGAGPPSRARSARSDSDESLEPGRERLRARSASQRIVARTRPAADGRERRGEADRSPARADAGHERRAAERRAPRGAGGARPRPRGCAARPARTGRTRRTRSASSTGRRRRLGRRADIQDLGAARPIRGRKGTREDVLAGVSVGGGAPRPRPAPRCRWDPGGCGQSLKKALRQPFLQYGSGAKEFVLDGPQGHLLDFGDLLVG